MTMESRSAWKCPACGAENVSTIWPTVNAKVSPELAVRVQDGSLFRVQCIRCSHIGQLNYTTQYHDMAHARYCMYTSPEQLQRRDYQFMESAARDYWSHYELRCVYDLDSLIELACIWRDSLDDITMLCVRLMLMVEVEQAKGVIPSLLRYLRKIDGKEGRTLEYLVILGDDGEEFTMQTADTLYHVLFPKVERSRTTFCPAGQWIDWTPDTAMKVLQSK
jgi:hypothetical protein